MVPYNGSNSYLSKVAVGRVPLSVLVTLVSRMGGLRAPVVQLVARFVRTPRGARSIFSTLSNCFVPPDRTHRSI